MRELREGPRSARDLSVAVRIPEKDVPLHLEHLERSLKKTEESLVILPAECAGCGYVFQRRTRFTRPGKCPECGATRVDAPEFVIRLEV